MTSPSPLLYDTYYHIYNRGINRENIYIEERNYAHFLNLYAEYIEPIADTFAYCLLKNHFHLSLRTQSEAETLHIFTEDMVRKQKRNPGKPLDLVHERLYYLSKKCSDFFNAYAKAINKAYGRTGSLFQHPFGRVMISSELQFSRVLHPPESAKAWARNGFSRVEIFVIRNDTEKPTHLKREEVLDWFGGREQFKATHAAWVGEQESRLFAGDDYD